MKLGKDKIVDAAFILLDEGGFDNFNLRALAKKLSVSATALYWHFKDKDELIKAMTQRIYSEAYAVLIGQKDLETALLSFGRRLHSVFGLSVDTARLIASAKPFEKNISLSKRTISEPLVKLGLSIEEALTCEAVIISYVLGWSLFDQNRSMHAYLEEMMDFKGSFELGLKAMVKGLLTK